MRKKLDRRTFLKGMGAALPLPYLGLMSTPYAQANTPYNKAPLRFVSLLKPNGIHPALWNINEGKADNFELSPAMQPFEAIKDKLLILDNLGNEGFSTHQKAAKRFLCGSEKYINQGSLDQHIAAHIGQGTRVRSLELTTEGIFAAAPECSYISYSKTGETLPRSSDPRLVFDRLFRGPLTSKSKRDELVSVLDQVRDDAKRLERRVGTEDKQVLDQYFTMIREAELRLESTKNQTDNRFDDFVRPDFTEHFDEKVHSMMDIMALALWTDSTRVTTYMLGNDNSRLVFDFLGINVEHHHLSHFFRNSSKQNNNNLRTITRWHMEKFVYFINKLDSYRDHHGSLLDNTLVHFGSGMGHSDSHTVKRVPAVLAGAKDHIQTGRYLRYDEDQTYANLHLTIANMFGLNIEHFANSTTTLNGWNGGKFDEFKEPYFDRWVRAQDGHYEAQGRLVLSSDPAEGNIYYLLLSNNSRIRIEVPFKTTENLTMTFYVGEAVKLKGNGKEKEGVLNLNALTSLEPLFIKKSKGKKA